ncbi:hypothetical protein BH23GEM11_BH23GEM11_03980 [soil metagenome]
MSSRLRQRLKGWAPSWLLGAWDAFGRLTWTLGAWRRNHRAARAERKKVSARAQTFPPAADALLDDFRADAPPGATSYERLFLYFVQGWETFRSDNGAGASYPGLPSWSGAHVDRIEGFARLMPLLGAWVNSGRPVRVQLPSGTTVDLVEEFTRGVVRGTDPASPDYWGDMKRSDQRIVEGADIALALWLFRDVARDAMTATQRGNVVAWLSQASDHWTLDNNWRLFVVLIDRVLDRLGHPVAESTARDHFERVKEFHLGDGWFRDGPKGEADYYNAWGFHYLLSWIERIDPGWDPEFIGSVQRRFLATYRYLIAPEGFPALGRSVTYRMAAPAPLVFGQADHPDVVSAGAARRALDCTWRYFIRNGALEQGRATQGYFRTDPFEIPANADTGRLELDGFSLKERFLSVAYDRPRRPENNEAKYGQRWYRSSPPFTEG